MNRRWIKVVERRGQSVLISSYFYNGIQTKYFKKSLNFPVGIDSYLIIDFQNYYRSDEVTKFKHYAANFMKRQGPYFFKESFYKLMLKGQELLNLAKFVETRNSKYLSRTGQTLKLFKDFTELCLEFGPAMYLPILTEELIEKKIRQIISRKIGHNNRYFSSLTASNSPTEGTKELVDLHKIAVEYFKNKSSKKINHLVQAHLKRFGWLSFTKFVGRLWNRNTIISRISRLNPQTVKSDLVDLRNKYREQQVKTLQIFRKFGFSSKERDWVNQAQHMSYFRTYRVDVYTEAGFRIKNLFKRIARRLGLSSSELMVFTYEEIISALERNKKLSKQTAEKRIKGSWQMLFENGSIKFNYLRPFLVSSSQISNRNIVKGQPAYKGLVRGEVKIIRGVKEFFKMENGAILVTSMTTPDFVPLMESSRAIVTDEGGITSHAAIVSRELGIPCIIGTKIATKVLKDGDLVEVDANRGIVKIIKRAE